MPPHATHGKQRLSRSTSTGSSTFTAAAYFDARGLYAWGDNSAGQLGRDNTVTPATSPVQVGAVTTWRSASSGLSHTSQASSPVQVTRTDWQMIGNSAGGTMSAVR